MDVQIEHLTRKLLYIYGNVNTSLEILLFVSLVTFLQKNKVCVFELIPVY